MESVVEFAVANRLTVPMALAVGAIADAAGTEEGPGRRAAIARAQGYLAVEERGCPKLVRPEEGEGGLGSRFRGNDGDEQKARRMPAKKYRPNAAQAVRRCAACGEAKGITAFHRGASVCRMCAKKGRVAGDAGRPRTLAEAAAMEREGSE